MASPSSLADAQEMYDLYLQAEKAILKGQAYSIGERHLTRANLGEVQKERQWWGKEVARLTEGRPGPRVTRIIVRDL